MNVLIDNIRFYKVTGMKIKEEIHQHFINPMIRRRSNV